MARNKDLKQLEEEQRKEYAKLKAYSAYLESENSSKHSSKSNGDPLQFFIGLIILGIGLFWVFQTAEIRTTWGGYSSIFSLGSWNVPNGTVIIPLLIGIVMLFLMDKKIFGWIVTTLGIIIILLAIVMSVRIVFTRTSLFNYILMFGLIAVGGGLVLKNLFKKRT